LAYVIIESSHCLTRRDNDLALKTALTSSLLRILAYHSPNSLCSRLTASGPFLQIGYPDMKIEVHDFAADTVEVVSIEKDAEDELVLPGRNVGRLYKGYAKGEANCSFEDAVERHELIEKLYWQNGYSEV